MEKTEEKIGDELNDLIVIDHDRNSDSVGRYCHLDLFLPPARLYKWLQIAPKKGRKHLGNLCI